MARQVRDAAVHPSPPVTVERVLELFFEDGAECEQARGNADDREEDREDLGGVVERTDLAQADGGDRRHRLLQRVDEAPVLEEPEPRGADARDADEQDDAETNPVPPRRYCAKSSGVTLSRNSRNCATSCSSSSASKRTPASSSTASSAKIGIVPP